MSAIEVLAADDRPVRKDATQLHLPAGTAVSTNVVTDLDWSLSSFGTVSPAAKDLARVAMAAYLADRSEKRSPAYFSRRMELVVHLDEPERFLSPAGRCLVDLLAWLTGDAWTLTPVANESTGAEQEVVTEERDEVMLLSGGLDSMCGAVAAFDSQSTRLHLGHRDQTGAVVHSQEALARALGEWDSSFTWQRLRLAPRATKDNSTRTRSLLFMALAIAAATAVSAPRVVVPENGFTSLNLAMLPSRGGALSTKSTHPSTFRQINALVEELGLGVILENPYGGVTKGVMLRTAFDVAGQGGPDVLAMAAQTISCSKLDGGLGYTGGSPNVNCGLCIACLVRRGAFIGAGLADPTDYLLDRVTPDARVKLINARHSDIWAVQTWATRPPTIDDLVVSARWPRGTDYDAMLAVVVAGRAELLEALDVAL
ncbi:hypothetical protein F9L07_03545 [Pimelobacter simplex]|uniref:7-cyano-7-deazaguanine synthase n=1 Tax=Nocardioides simplex TaxID=2045 RepID=A0A7J5DYG0_NOCSI|nr:hypothetical protein [Pimelobacter simplex]KAB2811020.1 hypothetical protein F9L07_03545 [Pimelobacter simplex]